MSNRIIVAVILLLAACQARAESYQCWKEGEFSLLDVREVYIEANRIDYLHDSYLAPTDQDLERGMAFKTRVNILRFREFKFYYDGILHFDQSKESGQIEHAGWKYELGLTVFKQGLLQVDLLRTHHSRHILEAVRDDHFPLEDRNAIRIWIVNREK